MGRASARVRLWDYLGDNGINQTSCICLNVILDLCMSYVLVLASRVKTRLKGKYCLEYFY